MKKKVRPDRATTRLRSRETDRLSGAIVSPINRNTSLVKILEASLTRAGEPPTAALIALPPCGRGLGPCGAVIETNAAGAALLRCIKCECIAPYLLRANKDVV